MNKRASSIHDLTSLTLHPDGSRVKAGKTNAIRDARGNWIAKDAGGWGKVPKRRRVVHLAEEEEESTDEENLQSQGKPGVEGLVSDVQPTSITKTKAKGEYKANSELKDPRAKKRRKLEHDFDFLADHSASSRRDGSLSIADEFPSSGEGSLPIPSSDLLKHIHYFAAQYYTSQGILLNSSRDFRRNRKEKKDKAKAEAQEAARRSATTSTIPSDEEDDLSLDEDGEDVTVKEETTEALPQKKPRPKNALKKGKKDTKRRDMFRNLDGSALMVLGMLMQHHVAGLMKEKEEERTDEWEAEMQRYEEAVDSRAIRADGTVDVTGIKGGRKKRRTRTPLAKMEEEEESAAEADQNVEVAAGDVTMEELELLMAIDEKDEDVFSDDEYV